MADLHAETASAIPQRHEELVGHTFMRICEPDDAEAGLSDGTGRDGGASDAIKISSSRSTSSRVDGPAAAAGRATPSSSSRAIGWRDINFLSSSSESE